MSTGLRSSGRPALVTASAVSRDRSPVTTSIRGLPPADSRRRVTADSPFSSRLNHKSQTNQEGPRTRAVRDPSLSPPLPPATTPRPHPCCTPPHPRPTPPPP